MEKREKITRIVTGIGNGAHVFTPKEWVGEEVILVRKPKPPVNDRILAVLKPYLENVIGVYLYGSYARGEAGKDSDIDLFVVTNKKIKIEKENYEIVSLTEDSIEQAIKISPILIYSALKEAKPIVNSKLLAELKEKYPIEKKYLKEYLKETKEVIEINEALLDGYSIVLRLRGVFIIKQLLNGRAYSHEDFKLWISKNSKIDSEKVLDKKSELTEEELNILLSLLKKSVKELEKRL